MKIFHNISAMLAGNALDKSQRAGEKSIGKLSSGLRINDASDDAAGLSISEKMRSQVGGLDQARRNSQDGISMIQTAEGALNESHSALQRMRELSVQAANDTLTSNDRQHIQRELDQLVDELERISSTTTFNGKRLLDGSFGSVATESSSDFRVSFNSGGGDGVSGNYRLQLNAKAGKGEVKKSNIFHAINGTRTEDSDIVYHDQYNTGIKQVKAVNMVEGDYSLQSREVPFGGTVFYDNGNPLTDKLNYEPSHGVVDVVAPGINSEGYKIPYGEYQFRATDTVPFMASYDNKHDGTGAVDSVSPPTGGSFASAGIPGSAPTIPVTGGIDIPRAVNSSLSFHASEPVATRSDALLWNISGLTNDQLDVDHGSTVLEPRADFQFNSFNTFDATVHERWRVAGSDRIYMGAPGYESLSYDIKLTVDDGTNPAVDLEAGWDIVQVRNALGGNWTSEPTLGNNFRGRFEYPAKEITIDLSNQSGTENPTTRATLWNSLMTKLNNNLGMQIPSSVGDDFVNNGTSPITVTFSPTKTLTTAEVYSEDFVRVTARWESVDKDGNRHVGQESSGIRFIGYNQPIEFSGSHVAYDKINLPSLMGTGTYPEPPSAPNYSWGNGGYNFEFATYTSPVGSAGNDVIRSQTGVQGSNRVGNPDYSPADKYSYPEIQYVFKDGVLDDAVIGSSNDHSENPPGKRIALPQLARVSSLYSHTSGALTESSSFRHSIYHSFVVKGEFSTSPSDPADPPAVAYNFRSTDPNDGYVYDHKAKAFHGSDATSYFYNGGDPSGYFSSISVWSQENSNANMAFRYRGIDGSGDYLFDIIVKGYENDGTAFNYEITDFPLTSGSPVQIDDPGGGGVGTINFDSFEMAWGSLTVGDAFIVNVSAAAHANGNSSAGTVGEGLSDFFWGTDTIATSGKPLFDDMMGASMEYRFIDGAVKDRELELIGLFVDPLDGADEDIGIQRQGFIFKTGTDGFKPPQETGDPLRRTSTDPDAFVGHTSAGRNIISEVNYVGASEPVASAVLTSYYFHELTERRDETIGVSDFVRKIQYNEEQSWNGSLVFDAVRAKDGSLAFRVQGHLYDGEGNYRYVEDQNVLIGGGENRDITLFKGDRFEGLGDAPPFEGIKFDLIELGSDPGMFSVGDRFVMSLSADAREAGEVVSSWDELNLFSDGLGTGYPITWRFKEGVLDNNNMDLKLFQVDSEPVTPNGTDVRNNEVKDGVFSLSVGTFHGGSERGSLTDHRIPKKVDNAAKFNVFAAEGFDARQAHFYTKLVDIGAFYDANGNFILEEPKQLEIRQGESSTKITIDKNMEIGDLMSALNRSIYGMSDDKLRGLMSDHDKRRIAGWVNWERRSGDLETVPGTFVLRSTVAGKEGQYVFSGDDDLLEALNLTVIQKPEENTYNITSFEAHTGDKIASVTAKSGQSIAGLIPGGASVDFSSFSGVNAVRFNMSTGQLDSIMTEGNYNRFVHVVDRDINIQTGSNQGEANKIGIKDLSARGLGLIPPPPCVYTKDLAGELVSRLDRAINTVSTERTRLGAYQNRLEHTISNVTVASQNLLESKSRIKDLDMAKEMMNFTKINILLQSGTSILAQANQSPEGVLQLLKGQ
ncbi:MAG: hypothetical protein EOM02_05355 [Synergistales bacterium]|nr:hypothetical protein [Synergistales bacterium]